MERNIKVFDATLVSKRLNGTEYYLVDVQVDDKMYQFKVGLATNGVVLKSPQYEIPSDVLFGIKHYFREQEHE